MPDIICIRAPHDGLWSSHDEGEGLWAVAVRLHKGDACLAEGAAGMYPRCYLSRVQMAEYKQSDADLEMPSNASTNLIPKQFHISNENYSWN